MEVRHVEVRSVECHHVGDLADFIVIHFAETEHGRSAISSDGHLAEFAVFEPDGIDLDPRRRFEQAYPTIAAMLDICSRELPR